MKGDFLSKLLDYYGLNQEGYRVLTREPSFSSIPPLEDEANLRIIKERLLKAKENNEKVIIYGDYDTDGIMSTSIMKLTLASMGIEAATYIPSRYLDGYGINRANAEKIASKGFSLVLTVDNGVAAKEALDYLKEQGIDVIIIDHHEIPLEGPAPSIALIHPVTSKYGEVAVSAGYLSFLVSRYILNEVDPYLLTLAATSTISDMMPLQTYNRDIVRLALKEIADKKFPQFVEFLGKSALSAEDLSMVFIPCINAIGRMVEDNTINRLISYFTKPFSDASFAIMGWMKEVNALRKEESKKAIETVRVNSEDAGICVVTDLKEGVNGLVANRLLNEYKKPVVVLSPKAGDPSILVGSLRSLDGFNVVKALESLKGHLLTGGGHALAGGLSIKASDFEAFKKDFLFLALKYQLNPQKETLIPLEQGEVTMENLGIIESFAPFGQEWKAPKFALENLETNAFSYLKGGLYLSASLSNGSRLFSFAIGEEAIGSLKEVSLKVSFRRNEYRGRSSVELLAEEII